MRIIPFLSIFVLKAPSAKTAISIRIAHCEFYIQIFFQVYKNVTVMIDWAYSGRAVMDLNTRPMPFWADNKNHNSGND